MMAALDQEALQAQLKKKRICRFCLTQVHSKITNVYTRDTRIKTSAPLPIQIMAIASIEVLSNDGMPPFVCTYCTDMFEYSYQFKQMCKKADNLLRQFPLTGIWPESLEKPVLPRASLSTPSKVAKTSPARMQVTPKTPGQQDSLLLPKKILNSSVNCKMFSTAPMQTTGKPPKCEADAKIIGKVEKPDSDCTITFLDKIDNNDELSLDDIHHLVVAEEMSEAEVKIEDLPITVVDSRNQVSNKPKLLNKSFLRILNKNAEQENEPRLSVPKIKQNVHGKLEVVAEILDDDYVYEGEPDPKDALPIETNIFPCSECDRTFPLLQLRDIHMKNHKRDRKFQCELCEKSYFSKYDLQQHLNIHNQLKPFKCAVCEKSFSRASLLTRHEKNHTDVPKYICVHCERAFISKDDLERHAERHNINRPFVCKICNKGFAFKQGLDRHEVIHEKKQPYPCQYCNESFSTTSKLYRHLTTHAGRRPYPCKFCGKSFLLSHHLTRHLRSHKNVGDPTNAISFICTQCNTKFQSRDELVNHSSTHATEMNLACPLCKDVYLSKAELVSHIQDHSTGETFACEFCDFIFLSAEKLQSHTDSDHTNEMEAYHADDRAQAGKQIEFLKTEQNDTDVDDDKLQNSVDEFLEDEQNSECYTSQISFNEDVKSETRSLKIINQIIIQNSMDQKQESLKQKIDTEGEESSLTNLKQRKLDLNDKKVVLRERKQSSQIKRKASNESQVMPNDSKQPTIQTLFQLPNSVAISKTPQTKTFPSKQPPTKKMMMTEAVPAPKIIKIERDSTVPSSSATAAANESKKFKIRKKITVTKAQAAAMVKEGRIKIKDGKVMLKKKKSLF